MTVRPLDWSPLAESDPIGGDPYAVRTEATYYSGLATEIGDQVARLRQIAGMEDLSGKAVDKLRSAAGELADKLNRTVGRVETVGSQLTAWVPHLEHAQSETALALEQAQEAHTAMLRDAPPPPGTAYPTTPAAIQDEADRSTRQGHAADALAAATTRFTHAVELRDQQATDVANKIKGALHDGLKDGLWDHISHWISQHAKLLKQLTEILGWIVTVLAVICIFVPGLNLIVLGATLLLLASHSVLAATGNGSWLDVALDVFALLTMGAGRLAGRAARLARSATLARAGELAAADAEKAVQLERELARVQTKGLAKFMSPKKLAKYLYSRSAVYDAVTDGKAGAAGRKAEQAMLKRELPEVWQLSMLERGKNFGIEIAQHVKDLKAILALYGDDPELAARAAEWSRKVTIMRRWTQGAVLVDAANHVVSRSEFPSARGVFPGAPPWEHFKELATLSLGQP